jgi:hypothetical protein
MLFQLFKEKQGNSKNEYRVFSDRKYLGKEWICFIVGSKVILQKNVELKKGNNRLMEVGNQKCQETDELFARSQQTALPSKLYK